MNLIFYPTNLKPIWVLVLVLFFPTNVLMAKNSNGLLKDSSSYKFKLQVGYFYNRYKNYIGILGGNYPSDYSNSPNRREFLRNGLSLGAEYHITSWLFARADLLSFFPNTLGLSSSNLIQPNNNTSFAPGGFSGTVGFKFDGKKFRFAFLARGGMIKLSERYESSFNLNGTNSIAKAHDVLECRFAELGLHFSYFFYSQFQIFLEPTVMLSSSQYSRTFLLNSPITAINVVDKGNGLTIYNFRTGIIIPFSK